VLEGLAKIVRRDVPLGDDDLLDPSMRHQIDEEPDRVGERFSGGSNQITWRAASRKSAVWGRASWSRHHPR
jgi:hypothetical protein